MLRQFSPGLQVTMAAKSFPRLLSSSSAGGDSNNGSKGIVTKKVGFASSCPLAALTPKLHLELEVGAPVLAMQKMKWRKDGSQMSLKSRGSAFKVSPGDRGNVEHMSPLQIRWANGHTGVVQASQVTRDRRIAATPCSFGKEGVMNNTGAGKLSSNADANISTPSVMTDLTDTLTEGSDETCPHAPCGSDSSHWEEMSVVARSTSNLSSLLRSASGKLVGEKKPALRAAASKAQPGLVREISTVSVESTVSGSRRFNFWGSNSNSRLQKSHAELAQERKERIKERQRGAQQLAMKPRLVENHFWARDANSRLRAGSELLCTEAVQHLLGRWCRCICTGRASAAER
eukprot:TRINITY_DN23609_c0_g1_i1.p1 TRINITY_DN23609_c0_g1~~TRINITY_DN23609_c0_g1_i1.p1  ORF type:complete len:345 (-),score=43.30 TRINITY_DN23609_c0_g1_i1:327-1361(-)